MSISDFTAPVVPSLEDQALAKTSSEVIARFGGSLTDIRLGTDGPTCHIPAVAAKLIVDILEVMADGQAVVFTPIQQELTTQQAAEVLGVSRPFLIKLLDSGAIVHRMVGTHRRVLLKDILEYKQERKHLRLEAVNEMVRESQRLNLY